MVILLAAALSAAAFAQQPQTAATTTTTTTAPPTGTLRDEVRAVLREETKDSKVVEVELAQAVAARLTVWTKLFGFFVGIPLGLVSLVLGFLGFKSLADLKKLTTRIAEMNAKVAAMEDQIAVRQKQLAELDKVQASIERLNEKVHRLETVSFAGAAVSKDVEARVLRTLDDYQKYLQGIGWDAQPDSSLTLHVDDSKDSATYAHYVHETKTMVIGSAYVSEVDLALREFTHSALLRANPQSEAEQRKDARGRAWWFLESGLAFYFPCGFKDDPHFAPSLHIGWDTDLSTRKKFADIPSTEANYMKVSAIWGATLWDLREQIGGPEIDRLVLSAWSSFHPQKSSFPKAFGKHLIDLAPDHETAIRKVFEKRGIAL
jgi:uncharacterized protein YoxC